MPVSMYQASIPVFVHMLKNLAAILDKAATHVEAKEIDPDVFINARLAPDMFALARQVQIATDTAKGCAGRLAGIEIPSFADIETTFQELQSRIAKTVTFLQTVSAVQVDNSQERKVTLKLPSQEISFLGQQYLFTFALPNFYFHVSIAYAILRHNGVELGKKDYLGSF